MYELIQVSEACYYINCPAKIGVYRTGKKGVYLIDSGNDKDAGRRVRQILEKNGWELLGILNTHSNADHIGGNRYLQGQTGCRVYAGGMEAAFSIHAGTCDLQLQRKVPVQRFVPSRWFFRLLIHRQ